MYKTAYPYWQLLDMMQIAPDKGNIAAILILAIGQWKNKDLSPYQFSGVLHYASEKVTTLK